MLADKGEHTLPPVPPWGPPRALGVMDMVTLQRPQGQQAWVRGQVRSAPARSMRVTQPAQEEVAVVWR